MQIPYMKVLIYILTLVGYCYSGYGSSIIKSVRDAVLSAEVIFGDVFKNFITISKKFKTVHEVFDSAIDENCIYQCPDNPDIRPMKNKLHIPTSDGCGSLGLKIDTEYLPAPEMAKCCDAHDICYDTCNSDKELCDLDFKRCLYKYCDTFEKSTAGDILIKGCKAASKMLFTGTMTLGCRAFLDAQQRACFCPVNGQSQQQQQQQSQQGKYNEKEKYKKAKKNNYGWKNDL